MSEPLVERIETFASGHWFGVKVERAWGGIDGAFTIYVGKGCDGDGGSWSPLPVPIYSPTAARLIARDLFRDLLDFARREACLYEQRAAA